MAEKEEPKDSGQKMEMKLGEYFLHVYVEESRQLAIGDSRADDVRVKLTGFGEAKYSKVKKDITSDTEVFYGEHFFFVKKFDDRELLENETLEVNVLKTGMTSLSYSEIGTVSLNLSAIYFEENHTLRHKWFVLQNRSSDKFHEVQGYLKLSINLSADTDEKTELTPEAVAYSSETPQVEIPPSIKLDFSQLIIHVISAVDLPKVDRMGNGINAFVEASFSGVPMKTKIIDSLTPYWNQKLFMQVVSPSYASTLKIQLWDKNTWPIENELIGTVDLRMPDIRTGKYKAVQLHHLYGARTDSDGNVKKRMAQLSRKGNQNLN